MDSKTTRVLGLKRRVCHGLGYYSNEIVIGFVVSDTKCHHGLEGQKALVAKPGIWQDRSHCQVILTPCVDMESYFCPGPQGHIATLSQRPKCYMVMVVEM